MEGTLSGIYAGMLAVNRFMRRVYSLPLWLKPQDAAELASNGLLFLRAHNAAARSSLAAGRPRFKVMPKYHLFCHLIYYLQRSSERNVDCLNILCFSCQLDEDFIGRVASQSRNVSIRTVHERTIQRYLLNLALRWWWPKKVSDRMYIIIILTLMSHSRFRRTLLPRINPFTILPGVLWVQGLTITRTQGRGIFKRSL